LLVGLPTAQAQQRFRLARAECWANTPCGALDELPPWEAAQVPGGQQRVEAIIPLAMVNGVSLRPLYLAQLGPAADPDACRLVQAHERSGGLLNLFGERATGADELLWHRLLQERLDRVSLVNDRARQRALQDAEQIWNTTPSELFSGLTPAEVWAGGGPKEALLLERFVEACQGREERQYPTRADLVRQALIFLRYWQVVPQQDLGGPPEAVIHAERRQILKHRRAWLSHTRRRC